MSKLPGWKLERYVLGELPQEELQEIDQRREEDPEIDSAVKEIEESNRHILSSYPTTEMVAQIRKKAAHTPNQETPQSSSFSENDSTPEKHITHPSFALPRILIPAAAAAALALFIMFSGHISFFGTPGDNGTGQIQGIEGESGIRLKGMEPGIQIFRKNGEAVEQLQPGTQASQGDLLQIGFVAPQYEYAVLFSVDGRGVVTLHSPENLSASTEITDKGRVLLDSAYRLDDAPQYERFYLITSTIRISAENIVNRARAYIQSQGSFPTTSTKLNSALNLTDNSEGQVKWYLFTLKK